MKQGPFDLCSPYVNIDGPNNSDHLLGLVLYGPALSTESILS